MKILVKYEFPNLDECSIYNTISKHGNTSYYIM